MGGVFGLAERGIGRPSRPPFLPPSTAAIFLSTARAGIYHLVEALDPTAVWMPSYLCPAMTECLTRWRSRIRFYPVSAGLTVEDTEWMRKIRAGDLVCVIDYFGFRSSSAFKESVREANAWVLEDACQALLTTELGGAADFLLFSCRKFLGVPDGGILIPLRDGAPRPPELTAAPKQWRQEALAACALRREYDDGGGDGSDRPWFELFRKAETEAPSEPFAMSALSKALLFEAFDYGGIAARRVDNCRVLQRRLGDLALARELPRGVVPLGFVVRLESRELRDRVRTHLFSRQIYPPVHWFIQGIVPPAFEESHRLANTTMTLPCDQRYGSADMERLAATVLEALDG